MRGRPVLQLAVIVVVASVVGSALGLVIDWFPVAASAEAPRVDTLYDVLLIASVVIFVLVMAVAIYSVIRWRARPGDDRDGPPIHGDAKLEVLWVAVPFLLVTALAAYGWIVLNDNEEPRPELTVVEVRAEQFAWSFAYPEEGTPTVRTANLMLPVDRQVEFRIETADVIHSFFIPAFRVKQDTVPGLTTTIRAIPQQEGDFDVVCTELCGIGHATMRQTATVMAGEEFDTWLSDRQEALAAAGGGEDELAPEQSPSGVAAQEPEPVDEAPAEDEGGSRGAEDAGGGGQPEPGGGGAG